MASLQDEPVMIIDCQTTGSTPSTGEILELGWGLLHTDESIESFKRDTNHYILQPDDGYIPGRIRSLTGITGDDLDSAVDPVEAWSEFLGDLETVNHIVAHYAQFESRFLTSMADEFRGPADLDRRFICTHEIARRLLDGLPRKGIRPVAGYWGHFIPDEKRTQHHLPATAVIWKKLKEEIKSRHNIGSIDELRRWTERTDPDPGNTYEYLIDRDRRLSLPDKPGVYRMLDRKDRVLYVGKASSLKLRVNSYFQSGSSLSESKLELVSQVNDVEVEPVETPLEASLREVDAIKELEPPYNSDLLNGDRSVGYVSGNLKRWSRSPKFPVSLGPISYRRPINQLRVLLDWLRYPNDPDQPNDPRLRDLFDTGSFEEALKALIENWNLDSNSLKLEQLHEIGIERLMSDDKSEDSKDEIDSEDDSGQTITEIRSRLESIIKKGTRSIRRGDWYRRLQSAEVFWKPERGDSRPWHHLNLVGGTVNTIKKTESVPELDEFVTGEESEVSLSIEGFDRLRVLTTEIKRLTSNLKPVRLISPNFESVHLNGRELESILERI